MMTMTNSPLALAFALTFLHSVGVVPVWGQGPHRLTLKEAIQTGLENHLRVLVTETALHEADGTEQRRLAALFPHLRAELSANRQTRNLRAQGISFPGVPPVVGPFSNYDARGYLDLPVIDLQSYHRWRASRHRAQAARHDYQDARDFIVRQVASLYLYAQAAKARVDAAESRVRTAASLDRLAQDQRDAGVATGVDVLRAKVQLANERQRALEARNTAEQSLLYLARIIGLDLAVPLELADLLEFKALAPLDPRIALNSALAGRSDYLSLQAQQEAARQDEKSNVARYFPRLSVNGNYGAIGEQIGATRGAGIIQGTLSISLFDWDRRGERTELESRRRSLEHRAADLRLGIEQEIRDALLLLESAKQEVKVAREGRALAERELELSQDRFQAGVTNNIEVVSAQEALARAHENYIVAVTRHADAKAALARAIGAAEESYESYLGIP